jgi:type I restriction enzyme S subunit
LYQYLASDQGQRQIDLCQAGGNRQGLNYQQIGGFQIPLPPIEEQQAIATVLSIWDRGINLLADLIDVKCRLKQGLMQQLLTGKRRFKGSREDWRIIQLRDVISECEERNRGQLGLNSVMAVTKAEGIIPMREGTIGADIGRYLIVRKNWFAYNPMRLNIGSIARWSGDREIVVSPDYVVFRCKDFNGDGLGSDV